jgi:hypothetical protein
LVSVGTIGVMKGILRNIPPMWGAPEPPTMRPEAVEEHGDVRCVYDVIATFDGAKKSCARMTYLEIVLYPIFSVIS